MRVLDVGCWIMVQEIHHVSDILLNLGEKLCVTLSCAWGENLKNGPRGPGIFGWNNLSTLVLSVHTKFHLPVPP